MQIGIEQLSPALAARVAEMIKGVSRETPWPVGVSFLRNPGLDPYVALDGQGISRRVSDQFAFSKGFRVWGLPYGKPLGAVVDSADGRVSIAPIALFSLPPDGPEPWWRFGLGFERIDPEKAAEAERVLRASLEEAIAAWVAVPLGFLGPLARVVEEDEAPGIALALAGYLGLDVPPDRYVPAEDARLLRKFLRLT